MAVCLQYRRHKRDIRRAQAGLTDRPARRSGAWRQPDPTGNAAAGIADATEWARRRVRAVEEAAHIAGGSAIAPALIEAVTEGRCYETLKHRPPCGRRQFYAVRLGFFMILDDKLR